MATQSDINRLRQILRDYEDQNSIPFTKDGIELSDDDLDWAISTALAEYNTVFPVTEYLDIGSLSQTPYVLVMNLAMAKALKTAAIRHARDSLPYGSEITINDTESRPPIYIQLAEEWEQKMLQFIHNYKRAKDSKICAIISTSGGWVPSSLLANDRGVINYE